VRGESNMFPCLYCQRDTGSDAVLFCDQQCSEEYYTTYADCAEEHQPRTPLPTDLPHWTQAIRRRAA
jgi:hypothetical protein